MLNSSILYTQSHLSFLDCIKLCLPKGWSASHQIGWSTQLWLVEAGGAYIRIGEKEYRVKAGDWCLLPETEMVYYGCDSFPYFEVRVLEFKAEMLSRTWFDWVECPVVLSLDPQQRQVLLPLYDSMQFHSPPEANIAQNVRILGNMYTLLGYYLEWGGCQEKPQKDWIGDTLQYIDRHLNEDLSVGTLAGRVALHPQYFIRQFRIQTGRSPAKYVADARFFKACALMQLPLTASQIGAQVGMHDTAGFLRFFKRRAGVPFSKYKNRKEL